MRNKKLAKEVQPGEKVFLEDGKHYPVEASYALSESTWVLEVEGIRQMIQVDPESTVTVWSN